MEKDSTILLGFMQFYTMFFRSKIAKCEILDSHVVYYCKWFDFAFENSSLVKKGAVLTTADDVTELWTAPIPG
jgi:hypothetical protein